MPTKKPTENGGGNGPAVTTIQLHEATRKKLRLLCAHTSVKSYEDLFSKFLIPYLVRVVGSSDEEKIATFLMRERGTD